MGCVEIKTSRPYQNTNTKNTVSTDYIPHNLVPPGSETRNKEIMLFTNSFWFGKMRNMAKKITHTIYQYTAIFEPDEKMGGFTVTIPSLPGCISEGDTFEKALQNIQEAASLYLEVMQSKKQEVS